MTRDSWTQDSRLARRAPLLAAVWLACAAPLLAEEWFDAYERGVAALRQRQGVRAVLFLERAIKLRPEPGTNVITYGTNRIEKYYPYLRLAQAFALVGDAAAAREALKLSERYAKEPADERAKIAEAIEAIAPSGRAAAPSTTATSAPPSAATAAAATALPTSAPQVAPVQPAATTAPSASLPVAASTPSALSTPGSPAVATAAAPTPAAAPTLGTLELRSDPAGATAFLGSRLLGSTPLSVDLVPGSYQITLRREGTADQSFAVSVAAGCKTSETRALIATSAPPAAPASAEPAAAAPLPGSLIVYSRPAGAAVYLDDELLGQTDPRSGRLVKSNVGAGPHRLRIAREGHEDKEEDVVVASNQPTEVRGELRAKPRLPPRAALVLGLSAAFVLAALVLLARRRQAQPASDAATSRAARTKEAVARSRTHPSAGTPAHASTTMVSSHTHSHASLAALGAIEEQPTLATPPQSAPAGATLAQPQPTPTPARPQPTPERPQPTPERSQASAAQSQPPSVEAFGPYRLLAPLGKGGMASVFKAECNGELVALKRPHKGFLEDAEFLERFQREADLGRSLHHPNIIRILDRGEVGAVPYFTMELIEGDTLQAHVRRSGRLSPKEAAQIVVQVAEALDYAHLKGVVHRDLKPSNIMLTAGGAVKVMDYGIARAQRFEGLTVTGAFLGTPDYVAPETAEGGVSEARSDLYSLGVVFYETITGKKPFVGATPFDTLKKHCSEQPTPPTAVWPGCPRELETIILRLLRKNPAERYASAEELLVELRGYLNRAA